MRISDWSSDVCSSDLQGFLLWFDDHAGVVKRDLEQGRDEVRILTVHGAKGLEAPVVILPDTCDLPQERDPDGLLWSEAGATQIGRAHVWTPVTNAHLVCRLLLANKKQIQ